MSTLLDQYPHCIRCPMSKYCGTAISSIKLCNSADKLQKNNTQVTNKVLK